MTLPPGRTELNTRIRSPVDTSVAWDVYVRLATGVFVYTAFVIDAFAGRIVG